MTKQIHWDAQPLGKVSDRMLARQLGVEKWLVRWQRQKRGIPAKKRGVPKVRKRKYNKNRAAGRFTTVTDWDAQPLGRVSDALLADQVGCEVATVAFQRRRRGIPAVVRSGNANDRWGLIQERLAVTTCGCGNTRFGSGYSLWTQQLCHVLCPECGGYITTLVVAADVAM